MRLKTLVACGALLIASSAAEAGGNCSRSGGPFAGPYIGAAVGVASSNAKQDDFIDPVAHSHGSSAVISGYSGYNLQCDRTIIGIESDYNFLNTKTHNSDWPGFFGGNIDLTSRINSYGSLRGRLGVLLSPTLLAYATGGLAYANVSHKLSDDSIPFEQTDKKFKTGWTLGAGLERELHTNWLLRAEAMYVDLGSSTHDYTFSAGPCIGVCTGTAKWHDDFWVARIGLTYKLGAREEYVPMK